MTPDGAQRDMCLCVCDWIEGGEERVRQVEEEKQSQNTIKVS